MILKNEYFITVGDREYKTTNLVTDYGQSQIAAGSIYPASIVLGNGSGTPSPSNQTIFSSVGVVGMDRSIVLDRDACKTTVTMSKTLDENTYADKDFTEIGIGSSKSNLYTHAMFTDALGHPITIHKGPLERMTIKVVAYITFPDANNAGAKRKLVDISSGKSAIGGRGKATCCLTQFIGDQFLYTEMNKIAEAKVSVSGSTVSASQTVDASTGSGVVNSYCIGPTTKEAGIGRSWSGSFSDAGAIAPIAANKFPSDRRPKETIGIGDGETREFALPYRTVNPEEIKVYIDDQEVAASIELVGTSSYSNEYWCSVLHLDGSLYSFSPNYKATYSSGTYSGKAAQRRSDIATIFVDLSDEPKITQQSCHFGDGYDVEGGNSVSVQHRVYNEYFMAKVTQGGGTYELLYCSDKNTCRSTGVTGSSIFINKDNPIQALCGSKLITIGDDGLAVVDNSTFPFMNYGSVASIDVPKFWEEGKQYIHKPIDATTTEIHWIDASFNTSYSTITHPAVQDGNLKLRFVDLEQKLIICVQTYNSGYVYKMSDDMSTILETLALPRLGYLYASDSYRIPTDIAGKGPWGDSNYKPRAIFKNADGEIAISWNYSTGYCMTHLKIGDTVEYEMHKNYHPIDYACNVNGWRYYDGGCHVPDKYKVVFDVAPEVESVVKVAYTTSSIEKSLDWQLVLSASYGFVK